MMNRVQSTGMFSKISVLTLILISIVFGSFLLGRYPVTPDMVLTILAAQFIDIPETWSKTMETVVIHVRFPRIVAAILVGGALSVSGAAYQSLFKNPLVSPAILGVSAGAGFGAALGMLMYLPWSGIQIMAFFFALVAVGASYLIGKVLGKNSMIVLVLGGMVISSIFQALLSVLKYLADPVDTLPAITFWLMGSLGKVSNADIQFVLLPILLSLLVLFAIRWQVNILSVGEEEAATLGVSIGKIQFLVVMSATMMTAAAVSISGIIGWVGLIIPHLARMLVGPNFHRVLPTSFLMGSAYLLLVDSISRSVSTIEIPLGILTALVGAPFFIFLLSQVKRGWS
ncbi:FecCD family ABC transporter permease [Brevibacillus sp. SYSU BS000544]|uniref:FecCD family ABC transporter permease n=1 Tax=Brevibacillus sp. SYSU BS000544 TaxID=3416443 RepID=UPI003CE46456